MDAQSQSVKKGPSRDVLSALGQLKEVEQEKRGSSSVSTAKASLITTLNRSEQHQSQITRIASTHVQTTPAVCDH